MYFCQKDKTMDSSGNGYWQERPTDIVRDRLEGRREAEAASNVTTVYDSVVKRQQKDGAEAKQAEKRQKTRNLIQGISGGVDECNQSVFHKSICAVVIQANAVCKANTHGTKPRPNVKRR